MERQEVLIVHPHVGISNQIGSEFVGTQCRVMHVFSVEEARKVVDGHMPDGILVAGSVATFLDGVYFARELVEQDESMVKRIVGITDKHPIFDAFQSLGCPARSHHMAAASVLMEILKPVTN